MKIVIKLNAVLQNKLLKWVVILGVMVSALLFLFLKIEWTFIYFLSILFIFSGIVGSFYLNRNEPETIIIEENIIKFSFFNKFLFVREDCFFKKECLLFQENESSIELLNNGRRVVIIRKKSLSKNDLDILKTYFIKGDF